MFFCIGVSVHTLPSYFELVFADDAEKQGKFSLFSCFKIIDTRTSSYVWFKKLRLKIEDIKFNLLVRPLSVKENC